MLENYPISIINERGGLLKRIEQTQQHVTPHGVYRITPGKDTDLVTLDPNGSEIKERTLWLLYDKAQLRLEPLIQRPTLEWSWNCEITSHADTYDVRFYNSLGGSLTVKGIRLTKNRTGWVSDEGVTGTV